ncbi:MULTISPECIES: hypothetical protein [Bradyrhizobium]|uniref:hypothetical protein n=1 Tax=Bradyrhizobium TaxID=374 RepID=UPI000424FB13|nr:MULTISPECIES: hypothetical protein [Bradyrhizobium]QOG22249.1 hypothetical protein FOM02_38130 [Bradyrhizobium sp. SEMIA]UFW50021.1 hypothetical protein BaraCB756_02735 [Bradyrhizobium arachidis]
MVSAQVLNWTNASVVFAFLAALLWGASAAVNIPLIGSGWGALVGLDAFYAAMRKVARLNMLAAASAALSALCQALSLAV